MLENTKAVGGSSIQREIAIGLPGMTAIVQLGVKFSKKPQKVGFQAMFLLQVHPPERSDPLIGMATNTARPKA
jgi:hypothetical protein